MGKEVEVKIQTDGKGKEKSMNIWHRGKTERQTHRRRLTDREEKKIIWKYTRQQIPSRSTIEHVL